jgi:hypothetical protein
MQICIAPLRTMSVLIAQLTAAILERAQRTLRLAQNY